MKIVEEEKNVNLEWKQGCGGCVALTLCVERDTMLCIFCFIKICLLELFI